MNLDAVCDEPLTSSCPAFRYSFFPDDIVTFTDNEPIKKVGKTSNYSMKQKDVKEKKLELIQLTVIIRPAYSLISQIINKYLILQHKICQEKVGML